MSKKPEQLKSLTLSSELVNAIVQYLVSKPFAEVNQLISGINQAVQDELAPKPKLDKVK